MRQLPLVTVGIAGALILSACTAATTSQPQDTSSIPSMSAPTADGTDSMSVDMNASSAMTMSASSLSAMSADASAGDTQARVIEMNVTNWAFAPNVLALKKGEKVVVRLTGVSGEHSFGSKDLGFNVSINPGETKDVEIPTDKAGTFSFRCLVPCGSGHMDMKGTITVS